MAEDAQRAHQHRGGLRRRWSTSPTARTRSTAKASATCTRSTPTKRGDITQTGRVWHFDKIRRSISTAAVQDGIVYYPDFSGFLHALDAKTGQELWTHDMFAAVWGSPLIAEGRVYLGDEDGDVVMLQAGRVKKVLGEIAMGSSVYSTPVPAGGVLYIADRSHLYALAHREVTALGALACSGSSRASPPVTVAARRRAGLRAGRSSAAGRSSPGSRPGSDCPNGCAPSGRSRPGRPSSPPPAIADGAVFVGHARRAGRPRPRHRQAAVDVQDGAASASANRRPRSPKARSTSATSTATSTPSRAADGQKRWSFKTGNEVKSSPVVAGKRVLVGSYDGHLYALDAATGARRVEGGHRGPGPRRPRRSSTGSPMSPAATSGFAACASPTGR